MLRTFLLCAVCVVPASAVPAAPDTSCGCSVEAFIEDPDTTGTNIRVAPKGALLEVLHPSREEVGTMQLEIECSRDGWLRVGIPSGKDGWIFGGLMAMGTRNYDGSELALYSKPDTLSAVSGVLHGESLVFVKGCRGSWAYVEYKSEKGTVVKGWFRPDMQCASPVTNCN
jgi:hypothetical protein